MENITSERHYWQAAITEMREQNRRIKQLDERLWWVLLFLMIDLGWRIFTG